MDVFPDGPTYINIHSVSKYCVYIHHLWICQYSITEMRHSDVFCTNPILRFSFIRASEGWLQWDDPNSISYMMLVLFIVLYRVFFSDFQDQKWGHTQKDRVAASAWHSFGLRLAIAQADAGAIMPMTSERTPIAATTGSTRSPRIPRMYNPMGGTLSSNLYVIY